jgi:hypothetical protein
LGKTAKALAEKLKFFLITSKKEGRKMKKQLLNLKNNRNAKINLLLILVLLFSVGIACKWNFGDKSASDSDDKKSERTKDDDSKDSDSKDSDEDSADDIDASTGEIPSDKALVALANESLNDFEKAVSSGDFSDFYDSLAKAWKKETSPEDLKKGFKIFVDNPSDVAKITSMKPEITGTPKIKSELGYEMLNVEGKYDTSPRNVKFELKYIPEGKDWKLSYIRVNTKD